MVGLGWDWVHLGIRVRFYRTVGAGAMGRMERSEELGDRVSVLLRVCVAGERKEYWALP